MNFLADALEPYLENLLGHISNSKVLVQRASHGSFANLLEWSDLNRILAQHRLQHPQLRLVQAGSLIPPEQYSEVQYNRRGAAITLLNEKNIHELLQQGATLVLDDIHKFHEPIRLAATWLEEIVDELVSVNAYASFGNTNGFSVHWDPHDVLAVQLHGYKKWSIYGETRKWPMFRDVDENTDPPPGEPEEVTLVDGDFLYPSARVVARGYTQ